MSVLASLSPVYCLIPVVAWSPVMAWCLLWPDPCCLTLLQESRLNHSQNTSCTNLQRCKTIIFIQKYIPILIPGWLEGGMPSFILISSTVLVKRFLVSVDTHMNLQFDNMEESMEGGTSRQLSKTLMRQIIPTKSFLIDPEPPWLQNPKTVLILNHGCLRFPKFFPTELLLSYSLFQVQQKMLEFNPDYSALNRIIWKII